LVTAAFSSASSIIANVAMVTRSPSCARRAAEPFSGLCHVKSSNPQKAFRTHLCSERRRILGDVSQAMPRGKAFAEVLAVKRCA
jgi:hypothetical protein